MNDSIRHTSSIIILNILGKLHPLRKTQSMVAMAMITSKVVTYKAKNGFGAYAGKKLFFSAGGVIVVQGETEVKKFAEMMQKMCGRMI